MQNLKAFKRQVLIQTVRNLFKIKSTSRLIELGEAAEKTGQVTPEKVREALLLSETFNFHKFIQSTDFLPKEKQELDALNYRHLSLMQKGLFPFRMSLLKNNDLPFRKTSISLLIATAALCALILASQIFKSSEQNESELSVLGIIQMLEGTVGIQASPEKITTRFRDVIGCDEALAELEELRNFLRFPSKYISRGLALPKGVLLSGPPGTGKTLIARALAGETGAAFFYCSGSEFDQVIVGLGAQRIRKLFERAKASAPSIIFIDEIDAIGAKRSAEEHGVYRQAINQILTEMDGFESSEKIVVLAATNFAQSLDPALVRSGRFDKTIELSAPDLAGRRKLIDYFMKKIKHSSFVDLDSLAKRTIGLTGADLKNLVNTAAMNAVRQSRRSVLTEDIEFAFDRVQMGVRSAAGAKDFSEQEKRSIAIHETGHALVALLTNGLADVHKVTILPAGPSLGHTALVPKRETLSYTKEHMLKQVDIMLGGRAAEELFVGRQKITTGCGDDLRKATDSLYSFVRNLGMEEDVFLGNVDKQQLSDAKNFEIDERVRKILEERYRAVKRLLRKNSAAFKAVVKRLVEKETLTKQEIEIIVKYAK